MKIFVVNEKFNSTQKVITALERKGYEVKMINPANFDISSVKKTDIVMFPSFGRLLSNQSYNFLLSCKQEKVKCCYLAAYEPSLGMDMVSYIMSHSIEEPQLNVPVIVRIVGTAKLLPTHVAF